MNGLKRAFRLNLLFLSAKYGAKPLDSEDEDEDEDEEVYVLRSITLPYIDYVRSCSQSKVIILHRWRKGQVPINESNNNQFRNN